MKTFLIIILVVSGIHFCFAQNVLQVEYAIDADKGFGKNTLVNIAAAPDVSFPFTVNFSSVLPGYHKLYTRTKDSNGEWGITSKLNIEVISANTIIKIISGEYFFDADPGFGKGNTVTVSPQDSVVLQNFTAVTNNLSVGYHKLYIRLKDVNKKWGITSKLNTEVIQSYSTLISGAEYFFKTDDGFGKANAVTFAQPAEDGSFTFNIPLDKIPTGANTLYIRANNNTQSWSITQWEKDSVVTTSGLDSLWSRPATWNNNKVPDSNSVVLLHHKVYVDITTAVCKSLTPYRNNAQCIVWPDMRLRIIGRRIN